MGRDEKLFARIGLERENAANLLGRLTQVVEGRQAVTLVDEEWAMFILMAAIAGAADRPTRRNS
jgi:hypothetical protein